MGSGCRKSYSNKSTCSVWLGGVAVGRRIRDREVASLIPGCSAARCNSGQVVHTRVPLFTKQYELVPASAGVKCTTGACCVGHAGSHSADLAVGGQPAPLLHRSYLWLPLYSGLEVTCHLRRYINCRYFTFYQRVSIQALI